MSQTSEEPSPLIAQAASDQRKGQALLAWLVIVAGVASWLWVHYAYPTEFAPGTAERASYVVLQMQARYIIGAADLLRKLQVKGQNFYASVQSLNTGSIGQRLRFITLAGELRGPEEALRQLRSLREKLQAEDFRPDPTERALLDTLERLYDDYAHKRLDGPSVSQAERQQLQEQLVWFGELALAPAGGPDAALREKVMSAARRTTLVFFGLVAILGTLGLAGLVGLILLLVWLFSGRIPHGVHCGSAQGAVYAETFAAWLVLFIVLGIAADFVHSLGKSRYPSI